MKVGLLPRKSYSITTQKLNYYTVRLFHISTAKGADFNTANINSHIYNRLSKSFILTFIRDDKSMSLKIRRYRARINMQKLHILRLFVFVMAIGGKNINTDLCFKNTINKPVFLRYLPAPTSLRFSFQRFRMSQACLRMATQFLYKAACLGKGFGFTLGQTDQIHFHLIRKFNFISHSLTVLSELLSLHLATSQSIHLCLFASPPHQAWQNTPPLSSR